MIQVRRKQEQQELLSQLLQASTSFKMVTSHSLKVNMLHSFLAPCNVFIVLTTTKFIYLTPPNLCINISPEHVNKNYHSIWHRFDCLYKNIVSSFLLLVSTKNDSCFIISFWFFVQKIVLSIQAMNPVRNVPRKPCSRGSLPTYTFTRSRQVSLSTNNFLLKF